MTDVRKLDEELRRVLAAALEIKSVPVTLQQKHPQSSVWPWQVPQVPAYTTDHTQDQWSQG